MNKEWLDKIDDILYELKVESNHIRRYEMIEEMYQMFKQRIIEELKDDKK